MTRVAAWAAGIAGTAVVAAALGLAIACRERAAPAPGPASTLPSEAPAEAAVVDGPEVDLYFPGDGRLLPERRRIAAAATPEARLAAIVAALLEGPRGGGLVAPLPAGTKLDAAYVWSDGTGVLDFSLPEGETPQGWGSQRELLAVYSLVDSITTNLPEVERVTFLWAGRQRATFAGHVDTTRPLAPAPGLVAGGL